MVALQNTLAAAGPVLALRLVYRQVGLAAFAIVGIENCNQLEADFVLARRRNAELKKLATLAKDVEAAPKRSRTAEASSNRKRRKLDDGDHGPLPEGGDADHGPLPPGGDVDHGPLLEGDDADQGPRPEDLQDSDFEADDVEGLFDARSDVSGCSEFSLLDVQDGMLDEDALADQEAMADALADAPPPRVIYDRVAGRIYENDGRPNPKYLGRISIVKPGLAAEAFSLYCTMHGCSVMKRMVHAPSDEAIVKWFEDGLDLPAGRSAFLQSSHKRMLALPAE
jgi:hypothetical protein